MKRSWDDDEEAAEDGLAAGGPPPSQSARVDDVGGKGGSRKGKIERKGRPRVLFVWPKRPFQGALPQEVVRAEDPMELLVEHFAVPEG